MITLTIETPSSFTWRKWVQKYGSPITFQDAIDYDPFAPGDTLNYWVICVLEWHTGTVRAICWSQEETKVIDGIEGVHKHYYLVPLDAIEEADPHTATLLYLMRASMEGIDENG